MSQSIIEGLQDYFSECPLLEEMSDGFIDWTSDAAGCYGIITDGDTEIKKFISGGGKREYSFTLQIRLDAEDKRSVRNPEWTEKIKQWCTDQNAAKIFPRMPEGCVPVKISAEGGVLYERDKTGRTGLYKIRFRLNYIKN